MPERLTQDTESSSQGSTEVQCQLAETGLEKIWDSQGREKMVCLRPGFGLVAAALRRESLRFAQHL